MSDAVAPAVPAPEQLVAAAHGEQRRAAVDRLADRRALRGEIRRDQRLLAILAAADVEQVVRAGRERVAEPDRLDDRARARAAQRGASSTAMLPRSA